MGGSIASSCVPTVETGRPISYGRACQERLPQQCPGGDMHLHACGTTLETTWCSSAMSAPKPGIRNLRNENALGDGTDFTFLTAPPSLVSSSVDCKARLWNPEIRAAVMSIEGGSIRAMTSVAFSPDGEYVLTSSMDGNVDLWDLEDESVVQNFKGHRGPVMSVVFSKDATLALTAGEDSTARLWVCESGVCRQTICGHDGPLRAAAISTDDRFILTASDDRTAKVWAVESQLNESSKWDERNRQSSASSKKPPVSGKPLFVLRDHALAVMSCSFAPDGKRAVTSSEDGTAKLWSLASGEVLETLNGHRGMPVRSAEFSQDGLMVVTASWDCRAIVWFIAESEEENEFVTLTGHTGAVTRATFCVAGKTVATSSLDGTVKLWSVENGNCQRTLGGPEGGPAVTCVSLARRFKL